MSRKQVLFWLAVVAVLLGGAAPCMPPTVVAPHAASRARGGCGQACGGTSCGGCCTQTVLVPEWATETHKVKAIECAPETRECKVTVFHCVAETSAVQRECTEMVPETRTRTETFAVQVPTSHQETEQYQVCVPTFRDVVHTYTVAVPIGHSRKRSSP